MDLRAKAVSGVKWSTVATGSKAVIELARISILTYLLEKSDFGIIAIAMMIIGFAEIFSNMGLTIGIIHKQNITQKQYSSVYWLNLMTSVIAFSILVGATPLLSSFYNEPILNSVIPLLGLQIIINAIGKIHQTIKTKELHFAFISKINVISTFIGFLLTVILAYLGFGVYSLVWGQLFQVTINQGIFLITGITDKNIIFHFSYVEVKEFISIGSYQLGSQILDFLAFQIDVFLIGYFFGMNNLGIYSIGKELVIKPFQMINALVLNVASAAFAKIQNDVEAIKRNYLKLAEVVTNLSFPLYLVIFIFADTIVAILYAPTFSEVAIFLRILIPVGMISSVNSIPSTLIIAKGRTDISFRWTVIRVVISTGMILFASFFSIYFVAASQSLLVVVFFFIYWRIAVYPLSGITLNEYLNIFKGSFLTAVLVALPFIVISYFFNLSLILGVLLSIFYVITYLVILMRIKEYRFSDLKQFIK